MTTTKMTPVDPNYVEQVEQRASKEGYIHHVLVAVDQLCNVISGGYPDETISARSYRWSQKKTGFILWRWLGKFMNMWLDCIQTNHCERAAIGDLERSEKVETTEEKEIGYVEKQP